MHSNCVLCIVYNIRGVFSLSTKTFQFLYVQMTTKANLSGMPKYSFSLSNTRKAPWKKDCKRAMYFFEWFAKTVKLKEAPMISHMCQSSQPKSFAAFVMAQTLSGGAITGRPQPDPSISRPVLFYPFQLQPD